MWFLRFIVVFGLFLGLFACQSTEKDTSDPSKASGKISGYTEGMQDLIALILSDNCDLLCKVGKIDAEGNFQFTLPNPDPDENMVEFFLQRLDGDIACLQISNEEVEIFPLLFLSVGKVGDLIQASSQEVADRSLFELPRKGDVFVLRYYVSADVTVTGTCQEQVYNLDLRKGWNNVVVTFTDGQRGAELSSKGTSMKWYFKRATE